MGGSHNLVIELCDEDIVKLIWRHMNALSGGNNSNNIGINLLVHYSSDRISSTSLIAGNSLEPKVF